MSLCDACMLCFLEFVGFFGFAVGFVQVVETLHRVQLTGHSGFHWKFQPFSVRLDGFLKLLIFGNNEIDAPQLSRIVELRFPGSPFVSFAFVELLS